MSLIALARLRRRLKDLPARHGVIPAKDPTMLFAGLMWGPRIALDQDLVEGLWWLKPALFQCGDRIVESIVVHHGLEAYRELLDRRMTPAMFIRFPEELVDRVDPSDIEGWIEGTDGVRDWLATHLDRQVSVRVLATWIQATNDALVSVLDCADWKRHYDKRDGSALVRLATAEEEHKNVRVVCRFLSASEAFAETCPYADREEDIVRATSRWFTLIDDYLDLADDLRDGQPNHLTARLVIEGELESYLSSQQSLPDLKARAPRTFDWYQEAFGNARQQFVRDFPVMPRLFRRLIERRAWREGASPF